MGVREKTIDESWRMWPHVEEAAWPQGQLSYMDRGPTPRLCLGRRCAFCRRLLTSDVTGSHRYK